jgi:hypothetical protein
VRYAPGELFRSRPAPALAALAGGTAWAAQSAGGPLLWIRLEGNELRSQAVAPPRPGGEAVWIAGFPADPRWLVAWRPASGAAESLFVRETTGAWRELAASPTGSLRWLGFASHGERFRIAVDERRPGSPDVLEVAAAGYARSELWRNDFGFSPVAVAPGGESIAVLHAIHPEADELLVARRATGEMRLLLPDAGDARFRPQGFSADGGEILYLTAGADGRSALEAIALADGKRRRVAADPRCDIAAWAPGVDPRADALVLDCGGRREAFSFDRESGRRQPLPAPSGSRALDFVPRAATTPAIWSTGGPRFPADWWTVGESPDEARPLTWSLAPRIDPAALVDSEPVVLASGGLELPGELWSPRGPRPAAGRPGVVWVDDDRESVDWFLFEPLAQALAQRGVAVLRLRPRGFGGFGAALLHAADGRRGEVELSDVVTARGALLARAGVDPRRVAILGIGAGGWVAALAAAQPGGDFVAAAAIGTALDSRPRLDATTPAPGPARDWWIARWGDPLDEVARRRWARLDLAALATSCPTLLAAATDAAEEDLVFPPPPSTPGGGALPVAPVPAGDPRPAEPRILAFLLAHLAAEGGAGVLP